MTSTRLALVLALTVTACGPGTKADGTGPTGGDGSASGADATVTLAPATIEGVVFEPEGLDRPSMLLARKKITLDKQRAAYKKAKPDAKADEAVVLATMLYEAGQKEMDDKKRIALWEEARTVLRESEPGAEPKAKAIVDHNLAILSYELNDLPGTIEALKKAVTASPTDTLTAERKAYLGYYLLRNHQNAEAAAELAGVEPSKDAPEIAYAIAWTAFRTGDLARARAGILAAAQGWRIKGYVPALRRDVVLFAGRTEMSVADAVALVDAFAPHVADDPKMKGKEGARLALLLFVHQSFQASGRLADDIALIDEIVKTKGLSKTDVGRLHLEKANDARRLGRPDDMVAFAKQGVEVLEGDAGAAADVHKMLFGWARLANTYYASSQDERWYEAARALYGLYLEVPGGDDVSTVQTEDKTLESNHARVKKNAGVHDKDVLGYILQGLSVQINGCYEAVLQHEPKLAGQLTVTLEISDKGEVTGASSDPAGGQQGVAAVAACAVERARSWVFPARTQTGVTRATVPYVLQPKAAP